jgi:hypothetical protein
MLKIQESFCDTICLHQKIKKSMLTIVEWKTNDQLFDFLDFVVVKCYKDLMKHVDLFSLKRTKTTFDVSNTKEINEII